MLENKMKYQGNICFLFHHSFPRSTNFIIANVICDSTTSLLNFRCDGTLTIILENRLLGSSADSNIITRLKLIGWRYGNLLKRMNRKVDIVRNIIKVQTEGNCCWKIFSKSRYRGQSQFLNPGFDEAPRSEIKSVKKMQCHEYEYD